jgi:hypothetical protein
MAITHFGSTSTPTDNGVLTDSAAQSITPVSSMTAGKLFVIEAFVRLNGETITVNDAGGQTITAGTQRSSGSISSRKFYGVFNGTWSSNPAFETVNKLGAAFTIAMSVFSPSGSGYTWSVDQAEAFSAFSSSTAVAITGQTPTLASSVTLAEWMADGDAVTWGGPDAGFTNALGAQIRNTQGTGSSFARAYLIQTSAAATGTVTNTASPSTSGHRNIITFAETAPASGAGRLVLRKPIRSLTGGALA